MSEYRDCLCGHSCLADEKCCLCGRKFDPPPPKSFLDEHAYLDTILVIDDTGPKTLYQAEVYFTSEGEWEITEQYTTYLSRS